MEVYSAEWVEEANKDYTHLNYEPCTSCRLRDWSSCNNEYVCLVGGEPKDFEGCGLFKGKE